MSTFRRPKPEAAFLYSLPRRELQALCKQYRIAANKTNNAMADALSAHVPVSNFCLFTAPTHFSLTSPSHFSYCCHFLLQTTGVLGFSSASVDAWHFIQVYRLMALQKATLCAKKSYHNKISGGSCFPYLRE
jgi:hypothetical protein